jgi:catechol 2,3-dioxygenase-like lactoylglutathione lyase family enzyme
MNTSRVQLALNVTDVERATVFYAALFGVAPAKQRPGYANFEVADPPLKLVLFENPGAGPLNHLGVEVMSSDELIAASQRFTAAGLAHTMSEADHCCHAVKDTVRVDASDVPMGGWEFYAVLADDPQQSADGVATACCGDAACSAPSACCAG